MTTQRKPLDSIMETSREDRATGLDFQNQNDEAPLMKAQIEAQDVADGIAIKT